MKVYISDIIYPHDEAREVRLFTRKRDRESYINKEIAAHEDVIANRKEFDPRGWPAGGYCAVYYYTSY